MKPSIKNIIFSVSVICSLSFNLSAQTDSITDNKRVLYTFAYNEVPDSSNIPLLGFVNVAGGNHKGLQLGFVDITNKNFKGLQLGFIDITKGNLSGSQIGFLNFSSKNVQGLQFGFGNHSKQYLDGSQIGFFNQVRNSLNVDFKQVSLMK